MPIEAHVKKLKTIYRAMDREYAKAASFYSFGCQGCPDNCCSTYFFHYTIAEYLYLLQGFWALDREKKEEIMEQTTNMCDPMPRDSYLCPLNLRGLCVLYSHRTMICRLHGLPFEVQRPEGQKDEGTGCAKFEKERALSGLPYRRISRTPFYTGLANLEREIRAGIGYFQGFKKTIAEMIRDGGKKENLRGIMDSLTQSINLPSL